MKKYLFFDENLRVEEKNVTYFASEKKWGHISEKQPHFGLIPFEQYNHSLAKRRLLKLWMNWRTQVNIAPHLPDIIEHLIYQNVYDEIKSVLKECFYEDCDLPFQKEHLCRWLSTLIMTAKHWDKEDDAYYWEEMLNYFSTCIKLELIDELKANH